MPLLCIAITVESAVDRARVAALIASQQPDDVLVVYPRSLSQAAIGALIDPDVAAEPLFPADLTVEIFWSVLAERFAQSDRDVLVLDAISSPPPVCWRRFKPDAERGRCVVFPHSVRGAASTIFRSNLHDPGLSAEQLDHWLTRYTRGRIIDLPAPAGFSGLLLNPALGGPTRYLLNDAVFVDDRECSPLPLSEDLPLAYRDALRLRHPDTALRHAMTELSTRGEAPPADLPPVRPVRLHVAHGWGGGLGHWVDDFADSDRDARSLVLKPIGDRSAYGQTIALYEAGHSRPLLWRTLAMPIISTDVTHSEYRAFLTEIIETFAVSALFVSSLIGHSLDLLQTGLPTVLVVHNFYPACPAILATFDGPCDSCSPARMERCFASNPVQSFFKVEAPGRWHAVRAAFGECLRSGALHVVAPSASTRQRLARLSTVDAALLGVVVPHGLREDKARALAACRDQPPRGGARLLVVVLGGQEAHKGGALLERIAPALAERVDFLVLGFGETPAPLARAANVTAVATFDSHELPTLLKEHRPDLGLLLSTVPETFSYTLSELQCAGIPTIATDLGAFRDRIAHAETGWRVPPTEAGVCRQIIALDENRSAIAQVRERLLQQTPRTTVDMVNDYLQLLPLAARVPAGRPAAGALPPAERQEVLLIDPAARFVQVSVAFYRYALRKALHSPRVPAPIKSMLGLLTSARGDSAGGS